MDTESAILNALNIGADDGRKTANGMKKGKKMAKLIDRDEAIKQINEKARKWSGSFYGTGLVGAIDILLNVPTVAAVPVVRCKDCKHWKPGDSFGGNSLDDMQRIGRCPIVRFGRRENDFCCEGERKDNG